MAQSPVDTISALQHLITEDDTPVDNLPSEKQQRLLTEPLYSAWSGPGAGRTFLAAANVGVFAQLRNPAIVPDMFLSLDVQVAEDWWRKEHRSYFVREFGKPPELVLEIVSNTEGNEDGEKKHTYAQMHVDYYVIYRPTPAGNVRCSHGLQATQRRVRTPGDHTVAGAQVRPGTVGRHVRGQARHLVTLDGRAQRAHPDRQGTRGTGAAAGRAGRGPVKPGTPARRYSEEINGVPKKLKPIWH